MKIQRFADKEKTRANAQKALSVVFEKNKNAPILFLSSGGSALELLEGLSLTNKKALITLGMLDDRFTDTDSEEVSNFLQLTKTKFFCEMLSGGAMLIDTSVQSNESLSDMAERFHASLQGWRMIHPSGVIIATMGIGADGHTAGIMSNMPKNKFGTFFENDEVYAVGYDTGGNGEHRARVTVTFPFLRMIDHALVYIVGAEKERALASIMSKKGNLQETPARIMREMKDVSIFTDIQ